MNPLATPLLIANWKANLPPGEEVALATQIARGGAERNLLPGTLMIAPSALGLVAVASLLRREHAELGVLIAAQDTSASLAGAETGELPAAHLAGIADAVILGHSERRARGEDGERIGAKVARCIESGLLPIVCLGDARSEVTADQRHAEIVRQWHEVLAGAAIFNVHLSDLLSADVVIAYEPVWAIGSGRSADPGAAAEVAAALRLDANAPTLRILYGGSVDAESAAVLTNNRGEGSLNGLLVGGASLDAARLLSIAAAVGLAR